MELTIQTHVDLTSIDVRCNRYEREHELSLDVYHEICIIHIKGRPSFPLSKTELEMLRMAIAKVPKI